MGCENSTYCEEPESPLAASPNEVIDTHIHLAVGWKEGEKGLPNGWLRSEGESFARDWTEADLRKVMDQATGYGDGRIKRAVFVECGNESPLDEARWVLEMWA